MNKVRPPRLLFFISMFLLAGIIWVFYQFPHETLPPAIELTTEEQPTIGYPKAQVHVVVFEEPKCPDCKQFTDEIYPEIRKKYIQRNKIRYTVIPVSFLPDSMPAAVALLCVYHQDPEYPNPDSYFKFLDYLFANQPPKDTNWATEEKLKEFAQEADPSIDTEALSECITKMQYRRQIAQNTEYGRSIMGGRIMTPTVYVDGVKVQELTWDKIQERIDQALKRKGLQP